MRLFSAFELAPWRIVWAPGFLLLGATLEWCQLEAGKMSIVATICSVVFFMAMVSAVIFSVDAICKDSKWSLLAIGTESFVFGICGCITAALFFLFLC